MRNTLVVYGRDGMQLLVRLLVAAALLASAPASADSWMPAMQKTYLSSNKTVRLTVIPRDLEDQLSYFSDKVDGKEPAGQRKGGEPQARAILERRNGRAWTKIWQAPLANEVAPVSALVTNSASYVVTFDNWHSAGFGDNVVVIYRADGSQVRSMRLVDILPEDYIRALPTSVSSIWWSGEHALSNDGRQVELKVVIPNSRGAIDTPRGYLNVLIDLATGAVSLPSGAEWDAAMAAAAPLTARSKASEATWRAFAIAALTAPKDDKVADWRRYLYQAAKRLAPKNQNAMGFGPEWILPSENEPDFVERARDIRSIFTNWDKPDDLMFASPSAPEAMARTLKEGAESGVPGRLAGSRLFVALPEALAGDVRSALKSTGATVIVFDPSNPIPQRSETLREMGVAPDQAEAEATKAAAAAKQFEADAVRLEALASPAPAMSKSDDADTEEVMADVLDAAADHATEDIQRSDNPHD
ncbi:hypothetical protein V473_13660 [Sphingobium cupriresistens LL01]|uniref:Uncharacterized protein n=2 Tax=Sphingobium cupriresistens TaxID=1132417 RepID=A0A0J8AN34_9SPHN|nr:hypothetical protein V473_13660 [Sphingobium cupriresistens LL01]